MNLNKTMLIGRVTRDPEVKALSSGIQVCSFSLATNRNWKDKEGNKKEDTDFHNLVSFGKTAEVIGQYVKKGQLIYAEGRNQTRSWDGTDGKKMYRTEIIVENFQFGPKAMNGNSDGEDQRSQADKDFDNYGKEEAIDEEINPDDIPF